MTSGRFSRNIKYYRKKTDLKLKQRRFKFAQVKMIGIRIASIRFASYGLVRGQELLISWV